MFGEWNDLQKLHAYQWEEYNLMVNELTFTSKTNIGKYSMQNFHQWKKIHFFYVFVHLNK